MPLDYPSEPLNAAPPAREVAEHAQQLANQAQDLATEAKKAADTVPVAPEEKLQQHSETIRALDAKIVESLKQ